MFDNKQILLLTVVTSTKFVKFFVKFSDFTSDYFCILGNFIK